MRICLISFCTPTSFNCGAPSALPYHLAKFREKGISLDIYSFNSNHISEDGIKQSEEELDAPITILPEPLWYRLMFALHLSFIRIFLKYPFLSYLPIPKSIVKGINERQYDGIWIYGEELSHQSKLFLGKKCVVLGPDCQALYYFRAFGQRFVFSDTLSMIKNFMMYMKSTALAKDLPSENMQYQLVGEEDRDYLKALNPRVKVDFLHHPHYDYSDKKVIKFSQPKIKLLVAGCYDYYMKDKCDEVFVAMEEVAKDLKGSFVITFLGKDWDDWKEKLSAVGYEVVHIRFAPEYMEELVKHDIQITPIGVGTGTKGKVLDAFANGLMVIGTLRALENIHVVNGESCILYDKPEEAINALRDIAANPHKYEQMAEAGREAVLNYHGRERVAKQIFNLFK